MEAVMERFMSKVIFDQSGCWEWSGSKFENGRSAFWLNRHQCQAHRVSYELFVGPIPEGLTIDHLCMNGRCVNPVHLEPVTLAENVRRYARAQRNCKHGHEWTDENTFIRPDGRRACRTCRTATSYRGWLTRRAKASA